jgi:hypothetical protein
MTMTIIAPETRPIRMALDATSARGRGDDR